MTVVAVSRLRLTDGDMAGRVVVFLALMSGLAGTAAYFLAVRVDLSPLDSFSPLRLSGVIGLSALITLANVASARVLLRGAEWNRSLSSLYLVITTSQAANYVTTVVVGMPVRVYLYNRVLRVATSAGAAMTVAEAVFGTATPAIVGVLCIGIFWGEVNAVWLLAGLVFLVAAVAAFLSLRTDRAALLLEGLPRPWWGRRGLELMQRLQESVRSLDGRGIAVANAIYVLVFALAGLRLYLLLDMVGSQENVAYLIGAQGLAFTAGTLSLLPMGIGARDATLLALLLGLGIDRDSAIAATVMERLLTTGWPFLLGLVSAQVLGFKALFGKDAPFEEGEWDHQGAKAPLTGESKG